MFVVKKEYLVNTINTISQEKISLETLITTLEEIIPITELTSLIETRSQDQKKEHNRLLKQQGKILNSQEAANALNITRQALAKRRERNRILAVRLDNKEYLYPGWQFTPTGLLPGLPETIKTLSNPHISNWEKLKFLSTKNLALENQTPLETLRSREGREENIEQVIQVAKAYVAEKISKF